MAHAENAENADFASRYALAASGMYTLGETPTHASLRCVLREISWTSQAQALRDLCETIISEKGTAYPMKRIRRDTNISILYLNISIIMYQ